MDFKKIKKLVSLVETSDISSLSVEEDNLKVEIKRELTSTVVSHPLPVVPPAPAAAPVSSSAPLPTTPEPDVDEGLIEIKSPMVGTFYLTPNPESPPFVATGKSIAKGDVVCIVEAMKLFNEIESEVSGTIETICVENGAPVEFDQPLFLVRPN
ncbi:MAG: acetyl-CoA carboxylase biotin carboxyl carrier protein [Candidatus Marinamargulisbacteria bacterium]